MSRRERDRKYDKKHNIDGLNRFYLYTFYNLQLKIVINYECF